MPTQSIKTSILKNCRNQWLVESKLLLCEVKRLELKVYTSKNNSGNLTTNASVNLISEDGMSITHSLFNDYNKRLLTTRPKRITLKAIEEQHKLVDWDTIIHEAKVHYGI
jgi:hypothetical protein